MPDTIIDFSKGPKKIALVVRGKQAPDHHPGKMEQHADAILQDGAPIGFYGTGNDRSSNNVGMSMQGVVYDYDALRKNRLWYVDVNSAVTYRVVSTVLVVEVDNATADKFGAAWDRMELNPGNFNIVGGNCSTHASAAFISAGVVKKTIPWLDTPDNLYEQLVDTIPASKRQSYTGFVGFTQRQGGGYNLVIRPYVASPKAVAPNPGSSGSLSSISR